MKKTVLFIFASFFFAFSGNAQCNGGIIGSPQTVCIGSTVTITNMVLPMNVSSNLLYEWTVNGYTIGGKNDPMTFVWGGMMNGNTNTIQRRVTDLVNSCSALSNPVDITYTPVPVNSFSATIYGDDTICSGSNSSIITSVVLNPDNNNMKYQWYINDGYDGYLVAIPGATNATFTPSNLTTEKKYLLQYYSDVFCSNTGNYTDWITKTVMDCGTFASDITGPTSIVPNQTATYSVTPVDGMKYLWAVTSGTITGGQGTYTITIMWDGGTSANARTNVTPYSVSVTETDATPTSKTTTQDVSMITTDINKAFVSTGITLFPNPSKDQFNIVMPISNTDVKYTVYTTTGVQMQSGSFTSSAAGNSIASNIPAGMYQLVLNFDGISTSTRLAVVE